jgi:hypothetical protein
MGPQRETDLMDLDAAQTSLAAQDGVISRRQLLAEGFNDNDIERLLRRRALRSVHAGVYVEHTGPLTWRQRAWAAVLACWPAALYGRSAVRAADSSPRHEPPRSQDELIDVGIEHPRKKLAPPGVRVHRVVGLEQKVLWNLGPPRMRTEEAVLAMCADEKSDDGALAIAADACQRRRTTPPRLLEALAGRRIRHGAWLRVVLEDIASGAHSLLEHGYLHRVERAHGLPPARRQLHESVEESSIYRDALYEEQGVVVELDGRVGHEWTDERWDDMDRDLDAGADGLLSVRLGWRHVFGTSCWTAERIDRILRRRGWEGRIHPCGPDCSALAGRPPAPGASQRPA